MRLAGQTLIFDADDTLWENNVLFERVIADFLDWLAHPTLDKVEIRTLLNDIEAANAVTHGYGSAAFLHNLGECFERLYQRPASAREVHEIAGLATALADRQVQLIPGVADTLADLNTRHDLLLFTKGNPDEQWRKVDASGLAAHFDGVHIVAEKHVGAYLELIAQRSLTPATTWMIGNSPKSDILPARRAGLNAVFIPNQHTWVLEQDELDPGDGRVLSLKTFPELLNHF